MLTSDLLRFRVQKPAGGAARIVPEYLAVDEPEALGRAQELIEVFARHLEDPARATRGAIDEAIDDIVGHDTDFMLWRGLAKLLFDRSEFEVVAPAQPLAARRAVFRASAELGPVTGDAVRRDILERAGAALGLTGDEVDESLYADLEARKLLTRHKPIEPRALLHRYNLALAQAVLYQATRMQVDLGPIDSTQLRHIFQVLKFRRLMFRCEQVDGPGGSRSYQLEIDGPASLFSKSRKYGVQMAMFLPSLFVGDAWAVRAELDWPGSKPQERHEFVLSHKDGLVSHVRARGQWVAEEERYFEARFAELETEWVLARQGSVVELAENQVIIPDYRLTHPDGREVLVEVVGFWRRAYLERRIELLVNTRTAPLVLVVSERLKTGNEKLAAVPAEVVFFKGVILANRVLEAAEAAAARRLAPCNPSE